MTITETTTEASAVVDDGGASVLAGGDPDRVGDVDPHYLAELVQAQAELERYCTITPDGGIGTPEFVKHGDIDFLVGHVARWNGCSLGDAVEYLIDEQFVSIQVKRWRRAEELVGFVTLDVTPFDMDPDLTAPKIVFVQLHATARGTKPLFDAGKRQYAAVWYQPPVDADGEPCRANGDPLTPSRNGRLYVDDTDLAGYLGVVDWFSDRASAKTAQRELYQALGVIRRPPPTAQTDDPVRTDSLDGDSAFDRDYRAWQESVRTDEAVPSPFDD